MKSLNKKTIDKVVNFWANEPIVYICDALGGLDEIIDLLEIRKEHKDVLSKLILNARKKATKMEEAIINKNYLLKSEGYSKCPHCGSYQKLRTDRYDLYDYESNSCCRCDSTF